MQNFDQLLKEEGYLYRFHEFQNLMRYRIREVLLVSSLYDSFILEEDGQLYDKVLSEYQDMNIRLVPGMTRVSNGGEALEMLREDNRFDLVITTLSLGDMDALSFARSIKEADLDIPVVLLSYETRELHEFMKRHDMSDFEKVFIWQGDVRILIAMLKCIEDRMNVDHDTRTVGVQSIIVIEDNVKFYSSYLPMIYSELFRHSQSLLAEGINVPHKLLRRRARPKILLCSTYEKALNYYKSYEECILGVITDIEFPRGGKLDKEAGIRFAREVRASYFDIPILFQTDSEGLESVAQELRAAILYKSSRTLLHDLKQFMKDQLSFSDFVFCLPDGTEVGRAGDLRSLERQLKTIPEASIKFHAERNHFSNWLKARTEFRLAHQLRPQTVGDFTTLQDLREALITYLGEFRHQRSLGKISDYQQETFDPTSSFARIGGGSLGGKARGLAFINTLINNFKMRDRFDGARISVPPAVVLGTEVFDQFMDENNLWDFALQSEDDEAILQRFLNARFPEIVKPELGAYLKEIKYPLAVRSSSLLEDSKYLPFAGIYTTYMLPNSHRQISVRLASLIRAVKHVYASTFFHHAKAYIDATHYRLEEEKMAVIIQKLVGASHGNRFYPTFAGVARSQNYYPRPPMTSTDGITSMGLGLGRMVIEGGDTFRFSPRYPKHAIQFADLKDAFKNSQKEFYALPLDEPDVDLDPLHAENLVKYGLDVAERDGTLTYVASTLSVENDVLTEGLSRPGVRLVTFAPLLKSRAFPLSEILNLILEMGQWSMSSPVEIEFAVNLSVEPDAPKKFAILQIRPLVKSHEMEELNLDDVKQEELLCQSPQVLGNGVIDDIHDIVMVDPDRFDRGKSVDVAQEVAVYNAQLSAEGRPYLLIGMGRLGSADSWLGIPVTWDQISGARVIVETGFKDFKVVPSQGTHFFQNLTSFRVGYFTVNAYVNEGFLDWQWLKERKSLSRKTFTRHLRLDRPIVVKMNGHKNEGIILKN